MTPASHYTAAELRMYLQAEIFRAFGPTHGAQTRWANKHNVSPQRVSEFLNGGKPTRDILRALGAVERVTVVYEIKE